MDPPSSGFLSVEAYMNACQMLAERSKGSETPELSFQLRHEQETKYFTIIRSIDCPPFAITEPSPDEEEEDEDAEGDNDQSAIHHPPQTSSRSSVIYAIIHSPTYQVPVLYFSFRNLPSSYNPNSIDTAYQLLAPKEARQDLESFGVMGAISMAVSTSNTSHPSTKTDVKLQNHPITDLPSFFVHPCNTAEAMSEILRGRAVGAFEYLLIWLGLVGSCVGLYVPKELALSAE